MHLTKGDNGRIVAYDLRDGAVVLRVLSVDRDDPYHRTISVESADGYSEIYIEDMYTDLDKVTERWRPATEAESAAFLARYAPATQNWN